MINLKRIQFGKWRFAYAFGRYQFRIRRSAKRAGSIAFGFGMFTYMKIGKYEPLPNGAMFST